MKLPTTPHDQINDAARASRASSSSYVVTAHKRPDLIFVPVRHRHESSVIVKDPMAMTYVRLRNDEYFVLTLLDGTLSLDQIANRYAHAFFPRTVKPENINRLLFKFHEQGLLVSSSIGQGHRLSHRANKKKSQVIKQAALSPLFIRFPGIDPDRFLNATERFIRPLLHPVAILAYLAMVAIAIMAFLNRGEHFFIEMMDLDRWLRLESVVLLMGVIGITKVLHELGHAYACKYFGGECHTIGPMLLLFSPALYCDTSDSWLLANRWQRAAVGAAGMAVEIILAAVATFVWVSTPAGVVHYAAMNVMLVCSASTLLFNANPLLRFDGYYILSDITDVPNLAQRSQRLLASTLTRLCLVGGTSLEPMKTPVKLAMLTYATLAWIYRWALTLSILYLLSQLLRPVGLESIGIVLCYFAGSVALFTATKPLFQLLNNPLKRRKIEMRRLMLTAVSLGLLVAVLTYPIPARVAAVATLTPHNAISIFTPVAGFIESSVAPGEQVTKGQLLVRLRNPAIELDHVAAKGLYERQLAQVRNLELSQVNVKTTSERLPAARAKLDDLEQQLAMHQSRVDALQIYAPKSGVVLAGERKTPSRDEIERLSEWVDVATDARNLGCFINIGTEICRIADPEKFEAELVLAQDVAKRVRRESKVSLCLSAFPSALQQGKVLDVSRRQMTKGQDDIDTTEAKSALAEETILIENSYLVRVKIEKSNLPMVSGLRGDALIATEPLSVVYRVYLTLAGLIRLR